MVWGISQKHFQRDFPSVIFRHNFSRTLQNTWRTKLGQRLREKEEIGGVLKVHTYPNIFILIFSNIH